MHHVYVQVDISSVFLEILMNGCLLPAGNSALAERARYVFFFFFFASQIRVSYSVIFMETLRGENVASTDQLLRKLSLLYEAQEMN
jgi:hypothetical protein